MNARRNQRRRARAAFARLYTPGTELVRLPNGWALHRVPRADIELEGELMGNCLRDGELHTPGRLLSLRDPDGVPHVTLELFDGEVMRAEGRFRTTPTVQHREMLERAFEDGGLGTFVIANGGHWGRALVWTKADR